MKVLLIQPPFTILKTEEKKCHPPLGLAYIAASLIGDGFDVRALDALAEGYGRNEYIGRDHLRYGLSSADIAERIIAFSPQVVGVSCLFSAQAENVRQICRIAKEINPEIITAVGGAHPSALPEAVIRGGHIDFAILGEGEASLKQLLQGLKGRKDISGIDGLAYKVDGRIRVNRRERYADNLDELSFPVWDVLPLEKYFRINNPHGTPAKRTPYLPVITSRGCPFGCVFCSVHTLWGANYRKRSAENVLSELEFLVKRFGVKEILFEDDNLTLDRERARRIFQGIIDRRLDIVWSTPNGIALQTLDDSLLELMAESGCYRISLGIESGDEHVLKDVIGKPLVLSRVRPIIKKAKGLGLEVTAFFVVGLPGESPSNIRNTFRFAGSLGVDNVNFFFATPLPGTRLLKLCAERGLIRGELDYGRLKSDLPCFATEHFSKEWLFKAVSRERLKLYLISSLRRPGKFLSKVLRKLFSDPFYFLRFGLKYLVPAGGKEQDALSKEKTERTRRLYGHLWDELKHEKPEEWHYNKMQEVIPEPIVRGKRGIDIGSGCGFDTFIMAKNNPAVKIVSLEASTGIDQARRLTLGLPNVWLIQGSALQIPLADNSLDFAYSFGVLHHTVNPGMGVREIARVIKKAAPAYLYLYEDHSENPLKRALLKIAGFLRGITVKLPPRILYILSLCVSPLAIVFFTLPHRIFKRFRITRPLSERIPFNFGSGPFSLAGDLYDRFGAPIEHRFSRQEIFDLLNRSGFVNISVARMKATAGWVTWGYKG